VNDSEFNAKKGGTKEKLMAFIDAEQTHGGTNTEAYIDAIYLRRRGAAYCPLCEKLVELLGFSEAADLFNTDTDDIDSLARGGEIHRIHNSRGKVLICSDSLFRCFNSRQTRLLDERYKTLEPKT